jgi:hypothetical protein
MKILFLDIDGVCNCASTNDKHGPFVGIDPDMAARVKKIIAETGCEVVLSSMWRLGPGSRREVRDKVCEFIDITPDLRGKIRGEEVRAWLDKHPEIIRHAILDDDSDFLVGQPLFKTTWEKGLTEEIMNDVIEYLNA